MPQREIEVILTRHLAAYLAMPIFIVDADGTLLYYNGPAEKILGKRFIDTDAMSVREWATIFAPLGEPGDTLPEDALPLVIATRERRPASSTFSIVGLDGELRQIDVVAFPLIGMEERQLGAVAIFWERAV